MLRTDPCLRVLMVQNTYTELHSGSKNITMVVQVQHGISPDI